ncbi:MAG TPA: hypothetical protein ENG20_03860 [Methanomicrobia archaeon]|nr:hypothetical protein [Methanomicrobia archaeon]
MQERVLPVRSRMHCLSKQIEMERWNGIKNTITQIKTGFRIF